MGKVMPNCNIDIPSKPAVDFTQDVFLDMSSDNSKRKYKKPKRNTIATTNPQASKKIRSDEKNPHLQSRCPLLAKDSEWLDGLQTMQADSRTTHLSDEEEVLQLVDCEDGPEMKPLTIMFPGLLEEDPQTLENMLNKTMSTTELTKHLLGQKADFSLMKKVNRLIPSDKKWLETLSEDRDSFSSELHDSFLRISNASCGSDGHNISETNDMTTNSRLDITFSAPSSSSKNVL